MMYSQKKPCMGQPRQRFKHLLKCLFLCSILALSISFLYGCAGIEEQIYSLKRDQAIAALQKGTITGDLYKNDYYRCQMAFGPGFKPELDFPNDLLVLLHKDGVTEVRLTSKVYPAGDFDLQAAIRGYSKKPTYRIVSQGPVTINRLRGIKAIFLHRFKGKPEGALMTSHVYFFTCKNLYYIISLSTPANYYESVALECKNVIDSFRVIQPMEAVGSQQLEKATVRTSKAYAKPQPEPTDRKETRTSDIPQREEFSDPFVIHKIQSGETLAIIAKHYTGKSENWRRIAKFNRIADPRRLQIGQTIKIPKRLCTALRGTHERVIVKAIPTIKPVEAIEKTEVASVETQPAETIESLKEPVPEPVKETTGFDVINNLSNFMAEQIAASGEKTIAVVDFADPQGDVTELGRFLAEEFSAAFVNADKGFEVVDRFHLKSILIEHKLSASGIIDPTTARDLGKIAGVGVIVTGTVTPFGERVMISAKALATQSAKVISASGASIPKTRDIEKLLGKGIETKKIAFAESKVDKKIESLNEPIPEAVKQHAGVEEKETVSVEEEVKPQREVAAEPKPKEEIEEVVQKEEVGLAKKEADESIKQQREPIPKPVKELPGIKEKGDVSGEEETEEVLEKEASAFEKRNVDETIESPKEPVVTESVKEAAGVVGKDAVSEEIGDKEQVKTEQEAIAEPKPKEETEELVERKEVASVESKVDEKIESLKEPIPEPVTGPPGVQEINELSKAMAEKIAASGEKTVAVVDFADLQGNVTELGRFLAEEISATLVNVGKGFEVVDRLYLKAILKEHKLSASGIIDPTTARDLGKIAGVGVIVTGTVTPFGERVKISAKALSTQSAKVICSSRGSIPKTQAIEDLLAREVEIAVER